VKTNILRAALFTPGSNQTFGLPMLLWGLPGIAKSAIMRQLAANYGMPIEVLSPASRGEGAFGVTPVPDGGRMTYPRPDWTDKFEKAGRGIVFVDEINLAATHYAGALLGLLQDRVLGSYQLGPGVRVFAAANPIDLAAASGGWDLSAPAANRVGHLDWPCPSVGDWSDWLLADIEDESIDIVNAADLEMQVLAAWPDAWARARGITTGFLSAHSTHLHALPQGGSGQVSRAWPSPRTWTHATRALASSAVHGLSERERDEFVAAFVGEGAAGELFTWLAAANLPDSAALLDGKVKWSHKKSRLDVTMAVFASATAVCVATTVEPLRRRRAEAMWALLAQASDSAPDLIVTPARLLVQAKLFSGAVRVLGKLNPILEAAGIQVSAA
jgi:MoxR-like ATPase